MKLNTVMPRQLKSYFNNEIELYKINLKNCNLELAWKHIERAHVIGQAYPWEHSYAHFKMLQFGIKIKSWKEILGQIPRLLIGGVKSFVGQIPIGNTGGSNIPPLRSMPIPEDIINIFKTNKVKI